VTEAMQKMVDDGWSITWLRIDGKYVVTGTRVEDGVAGIGNDPDAAWAVLADMHDRKGYK
jgi:hypothetical protein